MPTKTINFEQSLDKLNELVTKMEHGDISLEESLKNFEDGIKLIRECQKELKNAEQKVKVLTKNAELEEFETDDSE